MPAVHKDQSALTAWAWALACAAIVLAIDQVTKQIAVARIEPGHPEQLIFGIDFANVRNRGVAFGLFGGSGDFVVVITIAVNVPLNDAIKAAGLPDDPGRLAVIRSQFHEVRWIRWNTVRTVMTIAAFGSLLVSLVEYGAER